MANNSRITNSGTTNDGKNSFVVKKEMPKIIKINSVFQNLLNKLSSFPLIGGIQNDELLSDMNDKISNYTHGYLNKIRETTGADVTRFLNKTLQEGGASRAMSLGIRSTDDLFNNDTANFGAFFFERYKNINNKYEDLRIITEYLYELEEAVTTMRDNIISADDLVTMISRELSFKNITDQESRSTEIDTIISLEEKYKIVAKGNDDDIFQSIARSRNLLLQKGQPDSERARKLVLTDLRSGALGRISLDR